METEPPALLLGVDGGGSSCRARLADGAGRTLGEGRAGPANAFSDPDGSWRSIHAAIGAAYDAAGIDPGEAPLAPACLGIAGLDPLYPAAPPAWPLGRFASCVVETDAFIALRGAHAGADGAVLVVGTGVVGLAAVGAERCSVGGYGPILSDEGGGAWLGREAVSRMLWSFDGRLPWSDLTRAIQHRLGGTHAVQEWARLATAADFAKIAPLVLDAAASNDPIARPLIARSSFFLRQIVARLSECGATQLSVLGGLAPFLAPQIGFAKLPSTPAKGTALDGAILVARGIRDQTSST